MLSNLPKLADKAFILGFFLPALLFVLAICVLFPGLPGSQALLDLVLQTDHLEKLAYLVLGVWLLAIVMMMVNIALFQILEGYRWPMSHIKRFKRREQARFTRMQKRYKYLRAQRRRQGNRFPAKLYAEYTDLSLNLVREFPRDPGLHLPTRFGNAIRAFETYSLELYGADSIPLWLHLSSVISKEYQQQLDDARAQVNFLLNTCSFAAVVCVASTARFIWTIAWRDVGHTTDILSAGSIVYQTANLRFLTAAVAAGIVTRIAYLFSLELIYSWGDLVKAAFDCYLPALAEKLGYKLPRSGKDRVTFWNAISRRANYFAELKPEDWTRSDEALPPVRRARRRR